MNFTKKTEIYNRGIEEVKAELATFFLMNNFKVEFVGDDGMRVANLYPRFDIKRPPAAEIAQAVFKWQYLDGRVILSADAEIVQAHKLLKKRKRIIYTALAAVIITDLLYTSATALNPGFGNRISADMLMILLFIPLIYLILHYHFFKLYKSKHHNDLERLLENLQYK